MTVIYMIVGAVVVVGGLIWALVAKAKKEERERLLREQAELNEKIEKERVTDDEQIRSAPDDELERRLNRWSGLQPPRGE